MALRRAAADCAIVTSAAFALAGCGTAAHHGSSGPSASIVSVAPGLRCPASPPRPRSLTAAQLAAFRPVKAVECVPANRVIHGQGRWLVELRRVAAAKVDDLQAVFEETPQPVPAGDACTSQNDVIPAVALIDAAGRSVEPVGHRDDCGLLTPRLRRAVIDLPWHPVGIVKIRQQVSQVALTAGCDQQYENENADNALEDSLRASSGGPVFDRPVNRLRVCIYQSAPVDRATRDTVGDFVRGERLGPEQSRQLLAVLMGAGPRGNCPPQGKFAVVHAAGNYLNVELGGCWRVARDEDNPADTGSADATALRALLGLG